MNFEYFIDFVLFSIFALGSILLLLDDAELIIKKYQLRHRLKAIRMKEKKLPGPLQYIYCLVDASFEKKQSKYIFLLGDFALYIIAFLLGKYNLSSAEASISALGICLVPFVLLAFRMESERGKSSIEGISYISELHRQYMVCSGNIYEALEKTALTNGDFSISAKRTTSLLIRMRDASDPIALRQAVERFSFSYGTHWAENLGLCIRIAAEEGADVSLALSDIAEQLRKAYSLDEQSRLMNSEASRMTVFLVPLMYIGCFAAAIGYMGMTPEKLIHNQFFTPEGYKLFLINLILFILNLLLIYLTKNTKLDY